MTLLSLQRTAEYHIQLDVNFGPDIQRSYIPFEVSFWYGSPQPHTALGDHFGASLSSTAAWQFSTCLGHSGV